MGLLWIHFLTQTALKAEETSCAASWPPQYAPAPADRRPISGQFVVRGQELPAAYVRAKFEDRSFISLRNIGTFRCAALIDPVTLTFDL